jgi:lipase
MVLETRRWGSVDSDSVICVHGLTQHKAVFADMAEGLAAQGHSVVAVDLRGHGDSGHEPPWNVETHVNDLLETLDTLEIERASWIGHSFGGRVITALAASVPQRAQRLVLLDSGLEIAPDRALRGAETDRLDWSFATVDGAVNALMGSEQVVGAPRETVTAYVRADVKAGPDGRFRFSFCPSAVVAGWSEMALPALPIARVPTLFVRPAVPLVDPSKQIGRYEEELGELLTVADVPNGHNVLWESPAETLAAVEGFLARSEVSQ